MEWDVIIIGGGLAGSSAAIQLAQQNKKVLLLEKEKHAHHKVCGEFISYETQAYLSKLGVDLKELGAAAINHMQLVHGKREVIVKLPFEGLSLSRFVLDETLLQRALDLGVDVRKGIKVDSIEFSDDLWIVNAGDKKYISSQIFLATGKHDLKNIPRRPETQNDYIGFKMHWQLHAEQTKELENKVRVILFKGGYAGLELVEDKTANLCLVVTKPRFLEIGKRWDLLIESIKNESPLFESYLGQGIPCWNKPLAIFDIPYGFIYKNNNEVKGLFRLGDQMAVIPSFSGDGMAIALHSASCAVEAILNHKPSYHSQMRQELLPQIRYANMLSLITAKAFGQFAAIKLGNVPKLLSYIVKATRLRTFEK